MKGGVEFYLVGAGVLLALAGCGRSFMSGERAPWRHQAEVECMKSGTVKLGAGVVRMEPIEGPGMCGADFPLKVAAVGESSPLIGYADDLRPPGSIPNASQMPRWPVNEPRYVPPAAVDRVDQPMLPQSAQQPHMRWVPGPPPAERQPPMGSAGPPVMLSPPGIAPGVTPSAAPLPDDVPDDAILPPSRRAYPSPRTSETPIYQPGQRPYGAKAQQAPQRTAPALGPVRGQQMAAASSATLTPAATLACPIVSALDRWVGEGVQPAAMRWFGAQVVEIKQISSYSCRGMVGSGGSGISEHAFGNAIDIAAFTLADGRRITVQEGWHGTPEEQGFLHDVQLAACDNFNTVLAPGYNAAHYNHIHVDLMRRASGDRPCRPEAIPGEVAAAKARALYAGKHRGPVPKKASPTQAAVPSEDGYIVDLDDITSSIPASGSPIRSSPRRLLSSKATADRLTLH
ncbi:MAG: extensin family protein [Sphingobacteriales bacterium]